jgi:hypothetical protein
MKLSLSISLLGAVASVIALTTPFSNMECGNQPSNDVVRLIEADFPAYNVDSDVHPTAVTLNVIFHVIAKDNTFQGGNILDAQIQKQIQVLNQDFAQTGITYRLVAIDRTINPNWFDIAANGAPQRQMKQTLRKGSVADLNIYSVGSIMDGDQPLRGYATFPWDYQSNPSVDGVVVVFSSLPGGSLKPYDLGHTTTHEVGHWVGLYHPFQGGCTPPGDYVEDTPYEASASFGCQNGRDSCTLPGTDPIHNFMDYSDDTCVNQFTRGQYLRLAAAMRQFRGVSV